MAAIFIFIIIVFGISSPQLFLKGIDTSKSTKSDFRFFNALGFEVINDRIEITGIFDDKGEYERLHYYYKGDKKGFLYYEKGLVKIHEKEAKSYLKNIADYLEYCHDTKIGKYLKYFK